MNWEKQRKSKKLTDKEMPEIKKGVKEMIQKLLDQDSPKNTNWTAPLWHIINNIQSALKSSLVLDPQVEKIYQSNLNDLLYILLYLRSNQDLYGKIININEKDKKLENQKHEKKMIWEEIIKYLTQESEGQTHKEVDKRWVLKKRIEEACKYIKFKGIKANGYSSKSYMMYNTFSNIIFYHMIIDIFWIKNKKTLSWLMNNNMILQYRQ